MADKVAGLLFKISADTKALKTSFDKTQKQVSGMKKSFGNLGKIIGAAFATRAIVNFTKEVVKLAGEAEGVEQAFSRLENAEQLIKDLTEATRGTVSQLQLMKYAVQAKNFKIPLDQLAKYFEFATKRAAQTGESVDYLVNSIILGLGRGSIKILDNLGLSALELQRISKETGDVSSAAAQLIGTELEKMGDVTFTTNQQVASFAATWVNVKTAIGGALIETVAMNESLGNLATTLSTVDWGKIIDGLVNGFTNWYKILERANPGMLLLVKGFKGIKEFVGGSILPQKKAPPVNYNTERTKIGGGGLPAVNPIVPFTSFFGDSGGTGGAAAEGFKKSPGLSPMQGIGLEDFINQLRKPADTIKNEITYKYREAFSELGLVFQQTFMDVADSFGDGIEALFSGTLDLDSAMNGILQAFGGFISQMGKLILAYGIGMKAFRAAFKTPGGAIAAGIALMAIGSAISGLAARGPAVPGGGGAGGGGQTFGQIGLTGKIQGRDIVLAYDRGSELAGAVT